MLRVEKLQRVTVGLAINRILNEDTLALMGALNLGLKRTYPMDNILTFLIDLAGIIAYFFSVRKP